nr:pickpocket protein 28-like [Leptinotarsa decemlineata]
MDNNRQSEMPLAENTNIDSRNFERESRKKSFWKRIRRYFRDYCDNSSMIGFKFLGEKRSLGERILWFVIIAIAVGLSIYYILELYYKYEENPFIVNLATRESPIYTIPFPAVTICPVIKTQRFMFNFTKAVKKIWNNESLTEDESIRTQYLSLLCDNIDTSYKEHLLQNETFTEDFFDQLHELKPDTVFFLCNFMGKDFNCEDLFVPVILDDGVCYTFNMLNREDIFKKDVLDDMKIRELAGLFKGVYDINPTCNCMPLCTELSYDIETGRTFFPWKEKLKIFQLNQTYELNTSHYHFSKLSVFFNRDQFLTSQRNELYGPFDFLANFGGLLGLFTGFSLLSAVEILYYLSVRLFCNFLTDTNFSKN